MLAIDPTARIAPSAVIGANVEVGPYCVIGPNVAVGDNCRLIAHVHIAGHTSIGPDCTLYPFSSLGTPTNSAIQKYMNEKKVPQLFVATGATKWNDPKNFPWTVAGSRTTRAKPAFTGNTFCRRSRTEKSAFSLRTTTTGRTVSKV